MLEYECALNFTRLLPFMNIGYLCRNLLCLIPEVAGKKQGLINKLCVFADS